MFMKESHLGNVHLLIVKVQLDVINEFLIVNT